MFVDDHPSGEPEAQDAPSETDARQLLLACAAEAERQAAGMQQLDAALGAAVAMARDPAMASTLVSALMTDLQKADLMRQELDGLSRALALLVAVPTLNTVVPANGIFGCTPLLAMQQRLLRSGKRGLG
jgi:hypothetical protein